MSGEDETPEQPMPHPFAMLFGRPPTPAEIHEQRKVVLEQRKAAKAFAKSTLASIKGMQLHARELNTLYMDAPIRSEEFSRRVAIIREQTAVLLEEMEGLAEQ